jgi:hypothetical protein
MKKEPLVKIINYAEGELKAETERRDREIDEAFRIKRINAEQEAEEKRKRNELWNRNVSREINRIRFLLDKPKMSGFMKLDLKSGKAKSVKQNEFRPLIIDHSDPSYADGDIVDPRKER